MVYLIFTSEGFNEALSEIVDHKAKLWINDGILNAQQKTTLSEHHIQHCQASCNIQPHTNPNLENRDYQQVPPRDTLWT